MTSGPVLPVYESWKNDANLKKEQNTVYGYVTIINHLGRLIEAVFPTPKGFEDFQPHEVTYLKLLLVCSYARQCFLPIGKTYSPKLVYLDVLSASGLTTTKESPKDPIAGSCFLTPLAHLKFDQPTVAPQPSFSEVHTFELEEPRLTLLKHRRDALVSKAGIQLPPFVYHDGDANAKVPAVVAAEAKTNLQIAKRKERPLYLVFVDNQALNITMATIKSIQGTDGFRGDLIVHLPTSSIWRAILGARGNDKAEQTKLNDFFGSDVWATIKSEDEIAGVYHKCVRAVTGDDFQEFAPVRIKGSNTEFALCFYVRKTTGLANARGWMDSITKQAEACNAIDHKLIQKILARSLKGQKSLFTY